MKVHPWGALLSPVWLAAMVVLAVNDHVLKHSGLAGVVTGKLSDVAGMIVAPTLLACVLVVRSRGGLLACHAAVGLVFALLKISPVVAGWWPWRVVVDATDLLALPVLAGSWVWLRPAMRERSARARRGLATAAGSVGLLVCAATSPARHHPYVGDTYLAMAASDKGTVVGLRTRVQGTIELRCDDGVRGSAVLEGQQSVVIEPLPAAGAECKLQVLGVPGSHGPVTRETRVLQCEVRPDSFSCTPARPSY